jgi:hypothetical protein
VPSVAAQSARTRRGAKRVVPAPTAPSRRRREAAGRALRRHQSLTTTSASGTLERRSAGLRAELADPTVAFRSERATGVHAAWRLAVPTLGLVLWDDTVDASGELRPRLLLVDVKLVVALGVVAHRLQFTAHRRPLHRSPRCRLPAEPPTTERAVRRCYKSSLPFFSSFSFSSRSRSRTAFRAMVAAPLSNPEPYRRSLM